MATPLTTVVPLPCFSCLDPRCELRPPCSSWRRQALTAAACCESLPCIRQLSESRCWCTSAHGRDEAATSLVRRLFMLSSLGATLGSMDNQDVQLEASSRANSAGCMVTLTSGINER